MKLASFLVAAAGTTMAASIAETACVTDDLSTLCEILQLDQHEAVLDDLNKTDTTLTVFAPNNAAFEALGIQSNTTDDLSNTLYYHVVGAGAVNSTQLGAFNKFESSAAANLIVTKDDSVMVNGDNSVPLSKVVIADVSTDGGIVHVVDKVIIPPSLIPAALAETDDLSTLNTILNLPAYSELLEAINTAGQNTVFAPSNEALANNNITVAFAEDEANVLAVSTVIGSHVVAGTAAFSPELSDGQEVETASGYTATVTIGDGTVMVDDATVIIADLNMENGVVHIINDVLNFPPAEPTPEPTPAEPTPEPAEPTPESGASTMAFSATAALAIAAAFTL